VIGEKVGCGDPSTTFLTSVGMVWFVVVVVGGVVLLLAVVATLLFYSRW
jgi:hypothetical protein